MNGGASVETQLHIIPYDKIKEDIEDSKKVELIRLQNLSFTEDPEIT